MEHEKQQVIITIGREYGSGGHLIADMLGEKYGLPVYDSTIIEVIAKEKNLNLEKLKEYDEKPRQPAVHPLHRWIQQLPGGCHCLYGI